MLKANFLKLIFAETEYRFDAVRIANTYLDMSLFKKSGILVDPVAFDKNATHRVKKRRICASH